MSGSIDSANQLKKGATRQPQEKHQQEERTLFVRTCSVEKAEMLLDVGGHQMHQNGTTWAETQKTLTVALVEMKNCHSCNDSVQAVLEQVVQSYLDAGKENDFHQKSHYGRQIRAGHNIQTEVAFVFCCMAKKATPLGSEIKLRAKSLGNHAITSTTEGLQN